MQALIDNNSLPTAATAFRLLSDVALQALQPIGRANATAATFAEMAEIPGMKAITLTASDLVLGLTVLWATYAALPVDDGTEADKRRARAATIREIGELLGALSNVRASEAWHISLDRCHAAWLLVASHYAQTDGDPRAAAIADTWTREANYLGD